MRKLAIIPMLMILLFNWVGFQLYVSLVGNGDNQNMITRLDKDQFRDSDLVSIKIAAVHLSPYVNQKDFERINGQIEIQGRVFNYVKRRFTQDSLELLCIPNDQATLQRIAKYDFFKLVADLQAEQSKKTSSNNSSHKTVNGEYFAESFCNSLSVQPVSSLSYTDHFITGTASGFPDFDEHPPRLNA